MSIISIKLHLYKISIGKYISEQSQIVREKILKLAAKRLENYPIEVIENIKKKK